MFKKIERTQKNLKQFIQMQDKLIRTQREFNGFEKKLIPNIPLILKSKENLG